MKLKKSLPWIAGGIVSISLLLRLMRPMGDVEALSRMLYAETGFKSNKQEMAQIVFVAINRSRKWDISISQVVSPTAYVPGQAWTTGAIYRKRFGEAPDQAVWPEIKTFVKNVLSGLYYSNKGYICFVHPEGMPTPPCASNRVEAVTSAGRRCVTPCTAKGTMVGKGLFG